MGTKLEILRFFRDHAEEEYTIKELCSEFDLTTSAMWKNVRSLWGGNWIIKNSDCFPVKYHFNELFSILVPKTI